MSEPLTLEDFYKLFQESERQRLESEKFLGELFQRSQEESARRAEEADRQAARRAEEAERRAEEADRRLAEEAARRAEEAERQAARRAEEAERQAARRAEEADRRLAETKAETERTIQELRKSVASLTSRWGQFVENFIEPAVVTLFQSRGIGVQETHRRVQSNRPGAAMEIDILAVDGEVVVAVEVKSRLSKVDVDEFLEKLTRFKSAFPLYVNSQVNGAVAGIEIDDGVDRYAYRQGLFVIKQSGETVKIANDSAFVPRSW